MIEPLRNFYGRFERPISSLSLILGFVLDIFTLKRVDTLFEDLFILGYLIIIGIFITLTHLKETEGNSEHNPDSAHFWYVNVLQFAFGGVFSAYLVLYFRSADILVAWPFIALLATIFIANEFLKKHYIRLSFQISLFFLSIYWFMIFIVPVLLHRIGVLVFLFSGFVSLAIITIFIAILFRIIKDKFEKSKKLLNALIMGIFVSVNFLYFTNLIPPIPLSLKDAGIFHSIQKNEKGNYEVTYEEYGWRGYFKLYENFNKTPDEPVYAYSAVFSPKNLNLKIIHEWQYYNETGKEWVTESKINLAVVGGRDGGFRTYSMRSNLTEGKWRVRVMTEGGQTIGHIRFNVIPADLKPPLIKNVK
ncbi:MAG TPA: DUF2914 domain-containing protein [Candidatus Paceibacterota bacterium]